MAFLGTPHHGALLEKGGNLVDAVLPMSVYSAPLARLTQLRSCGITDLRHGQITERDWQNSERFALEGDSRTPVPLPKSVDCYAIAALKSEQDNVTSQWVGDGLVTLNSALGRHPLPELDLHFLPSNCWVGRNLTHNELLYHDEVYQQLRVWFAPSKTSSV